ncbi:MAG: glutathione S-transferase family protein [Gammaproteobacteria bacterium]
MTTPHPLPTLTVWGELPRFAIGFARDIRVRWALEEAGRPYQIHRLGRDECDTPAYRAKQPFGQMPVYQDAQVTLFESGAILHYIAQDCPALMPDDRAGRAHTLSWLFASVNSFEQDLMGVIALDHQPKDAAWVAERRPALEEALHKRLASVEAWLQERDYLVEERFTVADILLAWELKLVDAVGALAPYPRLSAYYRRCTARPAYAKALADHVAVCQQAAA